MFRGRNYLFYLARPNNMVVSIIQGKGGEGSTMAQEIKWAGFLINCISSLFIFSDIKGKAALYVYAKIVGEYIIRIDICLIDSHRHESHLDFSNTISEKIL